MGNKKTLKSKYTKCHKPKYNMWQNSWFMIKLAWISKEKKVIIFSFLSAVLAVALNIFNLCISPAILSAVERRVSIGQFFLTVAIFVFGLMFLSAASAYISTNTVFGRISIRSIISNYLNKLYQLNYSWIYYLLCLSKLFHLCL